MSGIIMIFLWNIWQVPIWLIVHVLSEAMKNFHQGLVALPLLFEDGSVCLVWTGFLKCSHGQIGDTYDYGCAAGGRHGEGEAGGYYGCGG